MARNAPASLNSADRPSETETDRPGETGTERDDRNLLELLQELRVAGLGVQVLFGFMLSLPFTTRFAKLSQPQRDLYLASLLLAAISTALLLGPVATMPGDVLAPGHLRVQGEIPGEIADPPVDLDAVPAAVQAQDRRTAAGWPLKGEQHPDGRGLPRPVGAKERENLTWLDHQVQVDDGTGRPVVLAQARGFDGRCHWYGSPPAAGWSDAGLPGPADPDGAAKMPPV